MGKIKLEMGKEYLLRNGYNVRILSKSCSLKPHFGSTAGIEYYEDGTLVNNFKDSDYEIVAEKNYFKTLEELGVQSSSCVTRPQVGLNKPLFITLEGGEGSGKSTIGRMLSEWLSCLNLSRVYLTKQPGGTEVGKDIREVIMKYATLNPLAELLLFYADRAAAYKELEKMLQYDNIVICDRYHDSSIVYQQMVKKATTEDNFKKLEAVVPRHTPDLTIWFDIDPEVGLARKNTQGEVQKYEEAGLEFHKKVHKAYQDLWLNERDHKSRILRVNADDTIDNVFDAAKELVTQLLNRHLKIHDNL